MRRMKFPVVLNFGPRYQLPDTIRRLSYKPGDVVVIRSRSCDARQFDDMADQLGRCLQAAMSEWDYRPPVLMLDDDETEISTVGRETLEALLEGRRAYASKDDHEVFRDWLTELRTRILNGMTVEEAVKFLSDLIDYYRDTARRVS